MKLSKERRGRDEGSRTDSDANPVTIDRRARGPESGGDGQAEGRVTCVTGAHVTHSQVLVTRLGPVGRRLSGQVP